MLEDVLGFSLIAIAVMGVHVRRLHLETSSSMNTEKQLLKGGCHCRKVRWQVIAPICLVVWECNCSICEMKRNDHVVVPQENFKLLSGEEALATYTFNTGVAKHVFCKCCGVQSFYRPRSNPDGIGITFRCIDNYNKCSFRYEHFEGDKWEQFIEQSGISKYSKSSS